MYLEIYPDIVFVLNFIIDFILLLLLKLVNRKNSSLKRLLGAAAFGALFAVLLSIFPWIDTAADKSFVRSLLEGAGIFFKIAPVIIMPYIAFGRLEWKDLAKQTISFYLITCFAGGLMNSIYYHTNLRLYLLNMGDAILFSNISWKFVIIVSLWLIPCTAVVLRLRRVYTRGLREVYETELILGKWKVRTKGFFDTGNCLYDPIYQRPVMVVERSVMNELLPEEYQKELKNIRMYLKGTQTAAEPPTSPGAEGLNGTKQSGTEDSERAGKPDIAVASEPAGQSDGVNKLLLRLRFIPYRSVDEAQGMMVGLMLDKVLIHTGKETICCDKVTAAICDNKLSPKEEYHVILHKELL